MPHQLYAAGRATMPPAAAVTVDDVGPSGSLVYRPVLSDAELATLSTPEDAPGAPSPASSAICQASKAACWPPAGSPFPARIIGPTSWHGRDLRDEDWLHRLSGTEVAELLAAVATFRASGEPLERLAAPGGRHLFPLHSLGRRLVAIRDQRLLRGPGLALLRGLAIEGIAPEDVAILFVGLGSHLGVAMSQNGKGHLLGHVTDLGLDPTNPLTRIYATRERQWFHTDSCDIVGLLCLDVAAAGGGSGVASSHAVYNDVARLRPDLLRVLVSDFCMDRKAEVPAGKQPFFRAPVFFAHGGRVLASFDRNFVVRTCRHPGVPPLSEAQLDAINVVEQLCRAHALHMELQPGDMQFVHNHNILHSREAFRDGDDAAGRHRRRRLLRLWLSCAGGEVGGGGKDGGSGDGDGAWDLPPVLEERFGPRGPDGVRCGIVVPGAQPRVPVSVEDGHLNSLF